MPLNDAEGDHLAGVVVEYQLIPAEIERARAKNHVSADEIDLRMSCFDMPVHLSIAGLELLKWEYIPILAVAIEMPRAVRQLRAFGAEKWDFSPFHGSAIALRLTGSDVEARPPFSAEVARAPFAALAEAVGRFSRQIRADLLAEIPGFRDHDELGAWFRGKVEVPLGDEWEPSPP